MSQKVTCLDLSHHRESPGAIVASLSELIKTASVHELLEALDTDSLWLKFDPRQSDSGSD